MDVAANGREAMKRMGDPPVDVVVTDILLPEMDGIETVREIRARGQGTKIIAISGGGSGMFKTYLDWARRLGADRTFEKPVDAAELLYAVLDLLQQDAKVPH